VSNHFFDGSRKDDTNQVDTRVDHNLSAGHRMFGRYSRRSYDMVDPGPLPLPADGGLWTTTDLVSHSGVANWNATFGPAVNNEFRFGVTRIESLLDVPWKENFNEKFGIKGLPDLGDDNRRGMTRFTPTGYAEVGTRSFWPNRNNLDLLHLANHTLIVRGTHVIKTGFEYRGEQVFRRAARFARGQMAFGGVFSQDPNNRARTGDGMADFLLGLASGGTIGNQNGETAATRNYALYLQDDWRITRRLTLNLGLRWERFGPPSYKKTPVARFEVDFASQTFRIVRPRDESDCGCEHDNNDFAPAWVSPSSSTNARSSARASACSMEPPTRSRTTAAGASTTSLLTSRKSVFPPINWCSPLSWSATVFHRG
jgi:outer membrane receptor protein involved in Fe transport